MTFIVSNNASTTLASSIVAAGTSITVNTGDGTLFPTVTAPDILPLTLDDNTNVEVVYCTAHTANSDTFTVTRGAEVVRNVGAPVSYSFTSGVTKIESRLTKGMVEYSQSLRVAAQSSDPSAGISNVLQVYGLKFANRMFLKQLGPSGVDHIIQTSIFDDNSIIFRPASGTTATGTGFGMNWVGGGTVTHPAPTTASPAIFNSLRRTNYATATSANAGAGVWGGNPQYWRGNSTGLGGFYFFARIADPMAGAASRMFVGMTTLVTTASVTGEPSAASANFIGFGHDAADATTNYVVMTKDGTTVTKTSLTTPVARAANNIFDIHIFCAPNSTTMSIQIDQVNTNGTTTTVHNADITATLPTTGSFLTPHAARGNAALGSAQSIAVSSIYVTSDY
jgi:hypothetical protein